MSQPPTTEIIKQDIFRRISAVRLYVIISSCLSRKNVLETLWEVIQGGADAVQLREKTMSDREYLLLAREFKKITSQSNTLFIVNDRANIARQADADGLHIGQSDTNIKDARKIIGYDKILGMSTHNISQARMAQEERADYISVGPLFYTTTKSHEPPVGLDYLKQVKGEIEIPYVAIGAINQKNITSVLDAGGTQIAVCSAIICSDAIAQTTLSFKTRIAASVSLR